MKGKCLCGSIEVVADDRNEIGVCHCTMCRRWTGGPMFAVHCDSEVTFNGGTPARYKSSDWAERGFCPTCGTHLFYHILGGDYILPAGLFQDHAFKVGSEIFIDEKPDFYDFRQEVPRLTGAQVFEQFAQK